jgi:hypothetical protein
MGVTLIWSKRCYPTFPLDQSGQVLDGGTTHRKETAG